MILTSVLYTLVTTLLLGVGYPLLVTGLAHVLFPRQAGGQLIQQNGVLVGSRLIGQPFSGDTYFHSRPSAAGAGYDATASGGSNYAATNNKLIARIADDTAVAQKDHPGQPVPIDLVTASASGLDSDITPAAADYQAARVARARGQGVDAVRALIQRHTEPRQFGVLGEPVVNVLELNLELDKSGKPDLDKSGRK